MSGPHEDGVQLLGRHPGAPPAQGRAPRAKPGTRAQAQAGRRRALQERQQRGVIDLSLDDDDDDDVQIVQVKTNKRRRASQQNALALGPVVPNQVVAAPAPPPPPPPPASPKGYKCVICLDRMDSNMATTTCGHLFCFTCISGWVQKSGNCPQCRTKLTKTKIIRVYPPS